MYSKEQCSLFASILAYQDQLNSANLKELTFHHDDICNMLFTKIVRDKHHRLYKLLLDCNDPTYTLMHIQPFSILQYRTNRTGLKTLLSCPRLQLQINFNGPLKLSIRRFQQIQFISFKFSLLEVQCSIYNLYNIISIVTTLWKHF